MFIDRPKQQITTERIEVCDWCGRELDRGQWRRLSGRSVGLTLGHDDMVFHAYGCWDAFVAKHREASGLKPLESFGTTDDF